MVRASTFFLVRTRTSCGACFSLFCFITICQIRTSCITCGASFSLFYFQSICQFRTSCITCGPSLVYFHTICQIRTSCITSGASFSLFYFHTICQIRTSFINCGPSLYRLPNQNFLYHQWGLPCLLPYHLSKQKSLYREKERDVMISGCQIN